MYDVILIKYGELNTKGKNKKIFINKLFFDIKNKLIKFTDLTFNSNRDRILINLHKTLHEDIITILKNIFGIAKIVLAKKTNKNLTEMVDNSLLLVTTQKFAKTFKIECKRADKQFPYSSDETKRYIADKVLENTAFKVDVKNPDFVIFVEIRQEAVYLFFSSIKGLGGLPYGITGKVLLLLSGGIDSPVAAYQLIKRGIEVEYLHFASPPTTGPEVIEKVKKLVKQIRIYGQETKLHIVNFTKIQNEIFCGVNTKYRITVMRRLFYKIAQKIAKNKKILAIATGESIGQVASQTLESIFATSSDLNITIFRPLATWDKTEIIILAKQIKTFELSNLIGEDCCSLFVPKKPIIKPEHFFVKEIEAKLYIDNMIEEVIAQKEVVII